MPGSRFPNPFVGPRPILREDSLFGRDSELRELFNRLQARRIVLLHSVSGAGKTSLVQAGLIPRLRKVGGFEVWKPIRVNLDPHRLAGVPARANRYRLSALLSLEEELPEGERRTSAHLASMDLAEYLAGRPRTPEQVGRPVVLIFDQFEEVLTVAPHAVDDKHAFFAEVGRALDDRRYWALFIIREDHLAALAPYRERIPTQLSNTFRIDLLALKGAREAAVELARTGGRAFPAVDRLIRDLSRVKVQQPDGGHAEEQGSYVEPVHLQITCQSMWVAMEPDDPSIDAEDLDRLGQVSDALAGYYARAVAAIASGDRAVEQTLREWVGGKLIVGGIRSQVRREPDRSAGLPNHLIDKLREHYLVRMEPRAGTDWYELSHDRLVEPVQRDNQDWEQKNLHLMQLRARAWDDGGRRDDLLLRLDELKDAVAWAWQYRTLLTETEKVFLTTSRRVARLRFPTRRPRSASEVTALVAIAAPGGAELDRRGLLAWRFDAEIEALREAFGRIQLFTLGGPGKPVSVDGLIQALRVGIDILYLVSHRVPGAATTPPVLLLQDSGGVLSEVRGEELVVALGELSVVPWLVVLAPFSVDYQAVAHDQTELGALLFEAGVPATLSLRQSGMVREYVPKFFERLLEDGDVDSAILAAAPKYMSSPYSLRVDRPNEQRWYTPGFKGKENASVWHSLIATIRRGRVVPILGPRLMESVYGSSRATAQKMARDCGFPFSADGSDDVARVLEFMYTKESRYNAFQFYQYHLLRNLVELHGGWLPSEEIPPANNKPKLGKLTRAVALHNRENPDDAYRILAALPASIYVTTNFDPLMEIALEAEGKKPEKLQSRWRYHREPASSNEWRAYGSSSPDSPLVYHMFGAFGSDQVDRMVLSDNDRLDFLLSGRHDHLGPTAVHAAVIESTLLFLGFRLTDWPFRALSRLIKSLPGTERRRRYAHIAVLFDEDRQNIKNNDAMKAYLRSAVGEEMNIDIYFGSDTDFLKELRDQLAAAGEEAPPVEDTESEW